MLPKFLKLDRPLDLPPQLKWKFAHEPELMGWTIRARNYNTFIANCMFLFMLGLSLGVAAFMYSVYEGMSQPWRTLSCMLYMAVVQTAITSMTHQRMKFAYRITQSGVEYCEWKDFPQWALTLLKWLTPLTCIVFLFLLITDSISLLGALIGPGGIGLMYLSMANSKGFREMHTEYHYYAYRWKDLTQLAVATNREVVDLKYSVTMKGDNYITRENLNIFCKRKQKEKVAKLIQHYLPKGVPFVRAKVNVPLSTD